LCRRFWESGRQRRYKGGEENTSSLAFTRPGEEDGKKYHQNDTVCSFFLMNSLIKKGTKKFGPWFWISSIQSLIAHITLIFMQLSP
jgi:hypothetical protein